MGGHQNSDGTAGLQGAVRALVHSTSRVRGEAFLKMMVRGLANLLGVRYVHVATVDAENPSRALVVAGWHGTDYAEDCSYDLAGSPCEHVLAHDTCWYPDDVQGMHPKDTVLVEMGVRAYLGTPLRDRGGTPLGLLAVMDTEPMPDDRPARTLIDLFAARAAAELELELATASRRSPSRDSVDAERYRAYIDQAVGATFTFEFDPPMPVDLPPEQQVDWMLERTRLAECNEAGARMWSSSVDELIGIRWREVFGENLQPGRQVLHAAISAGYRWDEMEHHIQLPDGKYHWFLVSGQGVIENGKVVRFRGSLIEITEQRRAEQARERARAHFLRLAERSPAAIYRYRLSPDPRFVYVNQGAAELSGYTVEELLAKPELAFEIVHPDDRHLLDEMMRRDPGTHASTPLRWLRKDGSVRWIEHQTSIVAEDDGRTVFAEGIGHDVTERTMAEEKLRAALAEITALKEQLAADNLVLREEVLRSTNHAGIVGHDAGLREVLAEAERVAAVDSAVLLLGETGTGKELLARAIHDWSARRDRPMVSLNCAAIPDSLVESELFGREKGAYTGALSRQAGRFEAANRSTLFLDEIGELPIEAQGKLLRVLEEGRYERLGSTQTYSADVRIVAATNRDLEAEVTRGRFRQDLFFRLNVYPIHVPPLRERREDIPDLVWHFVRELGARMGKKFEEVHGPSLAALQRHNWPGNVRELRNVVERAMIRCSGPVLRIAIPATGDRTADHPMTLDEAQRRHIVDVLNRTDWKVRGPEGAAAVLGVKPTTLDSRMRKLGIRRPK